MWISHVILLFAFLGLCTADEQKAEEVRSLFLSCFPVIIINWCSCNRNDTILVCSLLWDHRETLLNVNKRLEVSVWYVEKGLCHPVSCSLILKVAARIISPAWWQLPHTVTPFILLAWSFEVGSLWSFNQEKFIEFLDFSFKCWVIQEVGWKIRFGADKICKTQMWMSSNGLFGWLESWEVDKNPFSFLLSALSPVTMYIATPPCPWSIVTKVFLGCTFLCYWFCSHRRQKLVMTTL